MDDAIYLVSVFLMILLFSLKPMRFQFADLQAQLDRVAPADDLPGVAALVCHY